MTDMQHGEPPLSTEDFQAIRTLLAKRVGISLADNKQYLVVHRLTPIMRAFKFGSLHELIRTLGANPNARIWEDVIDVLAIHETSFFRDEAPFCQLRDEILPAMCEQAENHRRKLSIWSAGCSTGQEAYSIAMLLTEIAPDLQSRVKILGSDVSAKVLGAAEAGQFRNIEVCRGLSEARRERFFQPVGDAWQVIPSIRQMTNWRKFSLADSWPMLPRFDLVLLRNVMVYFETPVRDALIRKVHQQLNPGGRLVLGSAESLMALHHSFEPITTNGATHYRAE